MKVQHFIMHLAPKYGGPTASVPVQCIGTKKLGADMSIVVYDNNDSYLGLLRDNGVDIVEIPQPKFILSEKLSLNLRRYLKNLKNYPEIFHYHGVWMASNHWISLFGRNNHVKCVLNPRGDLELARVRYKLIKRIKKWLAWYLYGKRDTNQASCIIATSQQEADGMRVLGVTAPIAIIPNGVDLKDFPKKILHEKNRKKTMLFLSRINPIKGLEYLIEAWSLLPKDVRSNWELHIAGNSDPVDYILKLKRMVYDNRLEDSISFIGQIVGDEKIQKYSSSDVFVLPTLNENFGNVVAESLMCECPVITTKNAPWQCLEEYKCGWWIDLNVENLVLAMTEAMCKSDEERWEMGRLGRRCVEENFAFESVAEKTMSVYEWVLGKGNKPSFVEEV